MKTEMVKRKIINLKPDPDQPRKKFDSEAINNLAQTMKTQGIINPIEIDENDVIITGEMRWRAYKSIYKNGELVDCKLLTELDPIERFERQTIENIHHNLLTSQELEKAINKIWKFNKYNTFKELGKRIGITEKWVKELIRLPEAKEEIGKKEALKLKTSTIIEIDAKVDNKIDKQKIAKKAVEKNLTRDQVREVIKTTKTLPKDVKDEVLKPKSNITLEEAKEIAQMPDDVRKEILKPKSELTIKEAKMIADISKPEIRKEAMKHVKQEKKQHETTLKYIEGVAKGEIEPPKKIIDLDQRVINQFIDIKKQVVIKMSKRHVESYNEHTKIRLYKIMKEILEFLQKELDMKGGIINV